MSEYDKENLFAKILRKEIPCDKVYENEYALAFNDIAPKAPIHILVIPKGEYCSYIDFFEKASKEEKEGFTEAILYITQKFDLENKGSRLIANQGKEGGQEVPHFHVHICAGKNLGNLFWP